MSTESTNHDLPDGSNQELADELLSESTSEEVRNSSELNFPIITNDYVENDVEVKSKLQYSCQCECVPVCCESQKSGDKIKKGSCTNDVDEAGNKLCPGIQTWSKEVNGCPGRNLTDLNDLLTEDKSSQENYCPVRRKIVHGSDKCEEYLNGCEKDKNQSSALCIKRLIKAASESQNCQALTHLTNPLNVATVDGHIQKDHQHSEKTLHHAGDKTQMGLCRCGVVENLPSLPNSSDYNKNVNGTNVCQWNQRKSVEPEKISGTRESQLADSSDPVSSPYENLSQREYDHNQRPLLKTGDNIENTTYSSDKVVISCPQKLTCDMEASEQNRSQLDSDPINSRFNEQKALICTDDIIKTDLSKSRKVETSFPCGIIYDKLSMDTIDNHHLSCVDDPRDSSHPFDLPANAEVSQVEEQHLKHAVLHSGDNIKIPLHMSDDATFPCNSNCNKGGNAKNEHQSVISHDLFNLSDEEDRFKNDYQRVKMKLQELKHKFDKAVCYNDTNKHHSQLNYIHKAEKIKLAQEDKLSAKNDDPFDLSSEDDLYPEKYRPLKRKLRTDSKNCNENNNPNSELARADGAAAEDSQAVAVEAVLLKAPETKKQKTTYRVAYVHSQQLLEKANELIRIKGRAELVHSLITSFGLLQYLQIVSPRYATDTEILGFHCPDYISFLRDSDIPDGDDGLSSDAESYGLSYDCPLQKGIYETCALIGGATIVAAETLINKAADVAINWYGGWHHAKRDSAAGFCYINDIVLGILKLREKFDRILYVDIDLHHGDGVEEAFCMSPKVMTVSFHKYMFGFFPGTGSVADVGIGRGKYYCVNVPLLDGIRDAEFCAIFYSVMKLVREKFQPQVIVLQCGADTLSSDPMTSFNLTHLGISRCVGLILSWNLPTMLLGGGGYNFPNTAKCWSFLTSLAAGRKLPLDIPEHEHLSAYGPDFEMSTTVGYRKDCNTRQHLASLVAMISRDLSSM